MHTKMALAALFVLVVASESAH
ncbi:hypothetical protein LCGC14_2144610, partial [marine sediment metagenome]